MGTFKMRLLLIATSVALAAAAPHSEDRQKWRPAQGRDLSKFKPKLPEVAFGTPSAPRAAPKPFEFKKGNKSFAEECGLENPNGIEDRIVGGHEAAHHEWPWQVALFIRRERAICWATDHASRMGEERRQCWRDHSRPQYGLGSSSDKPGSLRRLLRQHHLQWDYVHRFCRRKGCVQWRQWWYPEHQAV